MTNAEKTETDLPAIVRMAGKFAMRFPSFYYAVTGAALLGSSLVALQNGAWHVSVCFLLLFIFPYIPLLLLLPFVLYDLLSIILWHGCMALFLGLRYLAHLMLRLVKRQRKQ